MLYIHYILIYNICKSIDTNFIEISNNIHIYYFSCFTDICSSDNKNDISQKYGTYHLHFVYYLSSILSFHINFRRH